MDLMECRPPRAKKSLGQHFLSDGIIAQAVLDVLPAQPASVVEIGAGPGTMTRSLAETHVRVSAVELDPRLVGLLRRDFRDNPRVDVVSGDALEVDIGALLPPPYAVFGNIPYYITGALIPRLLRADPRPDWVCVMVQLEVAERLAAEPGGWSLATLAVRTAASAEILMRVPAEAFDPAPEVDSALLMMRPTAPAAFADEAFFAFARAVFQERRKKLPNAVANAMRNDVTRARAVVADAGIDPMRRPQTLDLSEWETLYRAFQERA
jgi:16S rRNA (adenine1518-N6/adenine1519-N6)-dimethyltransferase